MPQEPSINTLLQQAWDLRNAGNYAQASAVVQQAESYCAEEEYVLLGRIAHIYMQLEADHGRYEKAAKFSLQSIAYYQQAQRPDLVAHATRHLADLQTNLGELAAAVANYQKAISIYREQAQSPPGNMANALRAYAVLLEKMDQVKEAIPIWEQVKSMYTSLGLAAGIKEAEESLHRLKE